MPIAILSSTSSTARPAPSIILPSFARPVSYVLSPPHQDALPEQPPLLLIRWRSRRRCIRLAQTTCLRLIRLTRLLQLNAILLSSIETRIAVRCRVVAWRCVVVGIVVVQRLLGICAIGAIVVDLTSLVSTYKYEWCETSRNLQHHAAAPSKTFHTSA